MRANSLAIAVFVLITMYSPNSWAAPSLSLVHIRGHVVLIRNGKQTSLKTEISLKSGDLVITDIDGTARVVTSMKSAITLGPKIDLAPASVLRIGNPKSKTAMK